jgi:redox-sensitive bicupin YhaK (pirin superfamily)
MQLIRPHSKDLGGGFVVRRSLPSAVRQAVGPFLFFDHFGPIEAQPGDDHDVRPHPHIGLATVTYLFEGAMLHRDSTGVVQRIEPGAINWMTAGRGIVHSERTPDDLRGRAHRVHGLQLWAPAGSIPSFDVGGAKVRVLIGQAFGVSSPVSTLSPTLYLDIHGAAGTRLELPAAAVERAVYGVDAPFELNGQRIEPFTMAVLDPDTTPTLALPGGGRVVMIGGAPLGHRHMVWNFVSSRRERIVQAEDDWEAQRFARVPGETGFIPLPTRRA